jgi:hypothetical protein
LVSEGAEVSYFIQSTINVKTSDGLDDVLLEPLVYVRASGDVVRAPAGGTTDGLSVPRCLQSIIPATGGDWMSAVLHDSAYRDQLEIRVNNRNSIYVKASYTQKQCDQLILEAMGAQGVSWIMRHIIYWALRLFGHVAFREDRDRAELIYRPGNYM